MQLRDYQISISQQGADILKKFNLLYLAMEVRTGKTLTALEVAKLVGAKSVLFMTRVKAIEGIRSDYYNGGYDAYFGINITNDEAQHKIEGVYDLIIHDEHHRFGAFPKMGQRTKRFKEKFSKIPMIFLSGTPTPESFSQIYHQFDVSFYSPFKQWKNFYSFANEFVDIKEVHIRNNQTIKDYSNCNPAVMDLISHVWIAYTQKEAGFKGVINERVITVTVPDKIKTYIRLLKKNRVIEGKNQAILADTGSKLMSKIHQISSGTVIFESGTSRVLDDTKAKVIRKRFKDNKIVIFYKYKEELNAIKGVFGEDVTSDVETWRQWLFDGALALQIQSGREGVTLSEAEFIVFYNIDYSAVSYWQARDRMTTKDRPENTVFWVFSDVGIEAKIYEKVQDKKDYTLRHFKRDYELR